MTTLTAPQTGQRAEHGLDVGERIENTATDGRNVITIGGGSGGRANAPSTGSGIFAAKKVGSGIFWTSGACNSGT